MALYDAIFIPMLQLVSLLLITFVWVQLCKFVVLHVWKPFIFRKIMSAQGIEGPPETSFDDPPQPDMEKISHDILHHLYPQHTRRLKTNGKVHMHWFVREARVCATDIEFVRKVFIKKAEDFGKSPVIALGADDVLHRGIFDANEDDWVKRRRPLLMAFHSEKIKGMFGTMRSCTQKFLDGWESKVRNAGGETEFDCCPDFVELTASTIAAVAFGVPLGDPAPSRIVQNIRLLFLLQIMQLGYSWIPFARKLPFPLSIQRWRARRELNNLVSKQIQQRRASYKQIGSYGDDVLGILLEHSGDYDEDTLLDQCKTIYATGHGSLSAFYSWVMLLLALHPEWQSKARTEVRQVFGDDPVDANRINKLHIVEMIIRETLRLYPPMPMVPRMALKDNMVGDIFIPKGLGITTMPLAVHHDPDLWGPDVNEFNPNRFASGSATASKHPMGYMAFSFGGRACIGQGYSQQQMRIGMAMILQRFEWSLSPSYKHNPTIAGALLLPTNGMPVLVRLAKGK